MFFCKLCKRDCSYVGNTTNLWQHLEEGHINEFRQAKEEAKKDNESNLSSYKSNAHPLHNESGNQPTLSEVMSRKQPYPRNSARFKVLNDAVCYFISKDMQPYQTVNDPGFRTMLAAFDP